MRVVQAFLSTACALTILLTHQSDASAALLAYEGFNYQLGPLNGDNGGSGWSDGWVEQPNFGGSVATQVLAGSLVPTGASAGLLTSGNHGFSESDTRAGRFLDTSPSGPFAAAGLVNGAGNIGVNGTSLYLSFLQAPSPNEQFYEFEFKRGSLGDPGRIAGIGNDVGNSGGPDVYFRAPNGQHDLRPGTTSPTFFVMKIDYTAGGDNVSIYVNLALGVQPATPSYFFANVGDMSFNGLSFASFIGPTNSVDEIRLGTTYADVTPTAASASVPEPSSLVSFAGLAVVMLARAARRRGTGGRK